MEVNVQKPTFHEVAYPIGDFVIDHSLGLPNIIWRQNTARYETSALYRWVWNLYHHISDDMYPTEKEIFTCYPKDRAIGRVLFVLFVIWHAIFNLDVGRR